MILVLIIIEIILLVDWDLIHTLLSNCTALKLFQYDIFSEKYAKMSFSVFFQTFYHCFCFNSHQAYTIYRLCHNLHICIKLCNFVDIHARFLVYIYKTMDKRNMMIPDSDQGRTCKIYNGT